MGSVLGSVVFTCSWCASSNAWCKKQAVTWWACLVRVMCAAFRNESAFPDVGTHAYTITPVHPLLSRIFPTVSKAADSMCIPPNMMTNFDSPWTEGHVHWMFLAMVNSGWSIATTGACPGWTSSVNFLMTSNECLTMAIVVASSWKSGNRYDVVVGDSVRSCRIALQFLNKWLPFCKMVAINVRMVYILQ